MGDLVVRWTIGDVSDEGFEALRLSIGGAWRVFGRRADYVVCVNSLEPAAARARAGDLRTTVAWRRAGRDEIPAFLARRLDRAMAEGVGWKFAPLRLDPGRPSLALDNDCILWAMPAAIARWLDGTPEERAACIVAADVGRGFGAFEAFCGPAPRNSGIRGLPAGFDFAGALERTLSLTDAPLASELDEQGLQIAALERAGRTLVVGTDEVSICSPFPPHQPGLGRCGAHFVGLNARELPWKWYDRPASEVRREHFRGHRAALYAKVGPAAPARRGGRVTAGTPRSPRAGLS